MLARAERRTAAGRTAAGRTWLPVAAALFVVGWGANQFPPMLLVYRRQLDLGTGTLEAMFGLYALGLVPGLLVAGPLSDRIGRRPVVIPAVALSLLASGVLMLGGATTPLFAGRFLAGVASGAAFSAGTAWLREASVAPFGTATVHDVARRAAIAMTAGFASGPLVAAAVAQFAPSPTRLPYIPHLAATAIALAAVAGAPETASRAAHGGARRLRLAGAALARFRGVVVPMAPWVFAAPAIAFALLPSIVGADSLRLGIVLGGVITSITAFAGIFAQPIARHIERRAAGRAGVFGLCLLAAGLVLGAATAAAHQPYLLVPSAVVLGAAYGVCLVAGLVDVQELAPAGDVATLTAVYYAVCYLGFATPYLLALAAAIAGYPVLLAITAGLALATALVVARASSRHPRPGALSRSCA